MNILGTVPLLRTTLRWRAAKRLAALVTLGQPALHGATPSRSKRANELSGTAGCIKVQP